MAAALEAKRTARAALALLDAQHTAEGVRLAHTALAELRGSADTDHRPAIDALLARPIVVRDRDVSPGDVRDARVALELVLEQGREARAAGLRVAAAVAAVLVLVALVLALWPAPAITARASGVYADLPGFGPAMAIDGDPETSWLLPNDEAGSMVVVFREPRHVSLVRVRSTTNAPWDDRGTRDYVVELARGTEILATASGDFTWAGRTTPNTHALEADGVDRVRVRIETWHREGGGLAELEIE